MINLISFVKSSKYREKIIIFLEKEMKMPSEIANKVNLSNTHTNKHLNALKDKGIIVCLNEEAKRGRLYQNTKTGLEILKYLISRKK
ncbi:MAG: winged helix-turn-helix domain-containing protein [Methanobrevibacter sp.]|nr:winged helix-turn-helix domain-containing protein [Methanobrevibacter sp.]